MAKFSFHFQFDRLILELKQMMNISAEIQTLLIVFELKS